MDLDALTALAELIRGAGGISTDTSVSPRSLVGAALDSEHEIRRLAWSAPLKWSAWRVQMSPFSGGPENGRETTEARRNRLDAAPVEVLQGQGMSIAESVRQIGVTQQTYCHNRELQTMFRCARPDASAPSFLLHDRTLNLSHARCHRYLVRCRPHRSACRGRLPPSDLTCPSATRRLALCHRAERHDGEA